MIKVRILPMAKDNETFKGELDNAYIFFKETLIDEKGWYYYTTKGMNIKSGTTVLLQFDNNIIASAVIDVVLKLKDPIYKGVYVFKTNTIKTFKPISLEEMQKYTKDINVFSQAKKEAEISEDFFQNLVYM